MSEGKALFQKTAIGPDGISILASKLRLRNGEPPDDAWVRDWTAWASAYKGWLRKGEQYRSVCT